MSEQVGTTDTVKGKSGFEDIEVIAGFDALKMKDDIQAQIWSEIKDLSSEERTAYWEKVNQRARDWHESIQAKHSRVG
jgi:hypothetical protein